MVRFAALWSNDDSLTRWALGEAKAALTWEVPGDGGLGLGWVQDGRSLLQRHPRGSDARVELAGLLSELRSRTILGCVDGGGPQEIAELSPFRFRSWLYAAAPSAALGADVKAALVEGLPDFLKRNIEGKSDGEVLFHHLLAELYKRDAFNMPSVDGKLAADALGASLAGIAAVAPAVVAGLRCVAMTERLVVGATRGGPLAIRQWRGVEEPAPTPLFAGHRPKAVAHPHYKAALIVSGPAPTGAEWAQIAPDHLFWVGRDGATALAALTEL